MMFERMHWACAALFVPLLAGCHHAAHATDEALHTVSFGRISATPFADQMDAEACRKALTRAIGFTHTTHKMSNGVQVVEAFRCDADQVIVEVGLKNRNAYPMQCTAALGLDGSGAWVGAHSVAAYEYAFEPGMSQTCFAAG